MKNFKKSDFICLKCGTNFPLPRVKRQREKGHIKDVYCIKCKKNTQHIEIREFDYALDFLYEINVR